MRLLRMIVLRPLRRDLLRTLLTVFSVALGVAVVIAIDLAGDAATGSFQASMETLAGKTDLEITANGGIAESWVGRLYALPVDVRLSPVIETQATLPGMGPVPVYGVDMVSQAPGDAAPASRSGGDQDPAGSLLITRELARRLAVAPNGRIGLQLNGKQQEFTIGRVIEAGTDLLVMDIASLEAALGRFGRVNRIDVTVGAGEDFERVEKAIRAALPASFLIGKPGLRSEENQRMVRAFRWNLRVLSYISLVVGAFLIYNTIAVSVVRRRAEIGILRAIGAARGGIAALFLSEALLLGLTGSALGVELGRLLAGGTVRLIGDTVNALYTTSRPTPVELTWGQAWLGLIIGAAVAMASALGPALEAMKVAPTEAMGRGAREHRARLQWRRRLAAGAVLALAAVAASRLAPLGGYPVGGYAAALLAIGASAFAAPAVVIAVNRITRGLARRRVESLLAGRSLTAALSRTSVVVAALATAIAMMASVGIMVGSFRETVILWLDAQLRADIYVRPAIRSGAGQNPPMAQEVPAILGEVPGVAAVDTFRGLELHYRGERATLAAAEIGIVRRFGRLQFLPGQNRDRILESLPGQDRAVVSEPFANKHEIRAGQQISIPIGERTVTLTVAGVYYEYSSSQGYVLVDRTTLLKYLPGQPPTNAAVYLAPGADAGRVASDIRLRTAAYGVAVARNAELRHASMTIFDRTFAITWALEAVAIAVAMLGAANSLLALVLDRRRELGLLRYLGASAGQIRGMILAEAAFLGLLATLLGLVLGFALSLLLIFVVNKQSFGWTIQFYPPGGLLAGALALVWCVTVLAAIYPAYVASRLNPIDVVHEE